MSHPLPAGARAWQEKVRRFVDEELIPFEVEAEMNSGDLPKDIYLRHRKRAKEIGLYALAIPKEHGGQGLTNLEQAIVSEQVGRVTNALGLVLFLDAALDAGGLRRQRLSDEDLGHAEHPRRAP